MTYQDRPTYKLVNKLYKDERGQPIKLTKTQLEIFELIAGRLSPRNHIMTHTRFGKSLVVALAILTRVTTYPEKWAIVAGTIQKAQIIMNYVISHIFDNEFTATRFRMESGDSAESIRRHKNKKHLTFNVGKGPDGRDLISELFIGSAKEAVGFGAPNVVGDEASLVPDDEWGLVMRMLGDNPQDSFLVKIGNPFFRNHFLESSMDPEYNKIFVDHRQGVEEGRLTSAYVEEMSKYSYFDVMYEVKFPTAESIDDKGWSYLLTEADIKLATERWKSFEHYGKKRLGNDVARGGRNFNVYALRGENYATILKKDHNNDLMTIAGQNKAYMQEHRINQEDISIDDVGVGGGVTDRMKEEGIYPNAVKEGAKATETVMKYNPKTGKDEDQPEYANMRAQLYAGRNGLANWIKRIGALDPSIDWSELTRIRYKKNPQGLTMIESKDDMRKRGEESPDVADALMLTFFEAGIKPKNTFRMPDSVGGLK